MQPEDTVAVQSQAVVTAAEQPLAAFVVERQSAADSAAVVAAAHILAAEAVAAVVVADDVEPLSPILIMKQGPIESHLPQTIGRWDFWLLAHPTVSQHP
jgi:hypothetical protein